MTEIYDYSTPNTFYIYPQEVDGSFGAPTILATHADGLSSSQIATGDLDGDGKTDAAIAQSPGIDLFYQQNGVLGNNVFIRTRTQTTTVQIADLNADGKQDLVAQEGDGTYAYFNTGTGFGSAKKLTSLTGLFGVAEFTGDDRLDLAELTGFYLTLTAHVLVQDPGGTFTDTPHPVPLSGNYPIGGFVVGDVSGDGRADVALTIAANQPNSQIIVLTQTTQGTLSSPVAYPVLDIPGPVAVADIDGDGRNDLTTIHVGWNNLGVLLQDQGGTLSQETLYPTPYLQSQFDSLAVGDINGDNAADVADADANSTLVIFLQQGRAIRPPHP